MNSGQMSDCGGTPASRLRLWLLLIVILVTVLTGCGSQSGPISGSILLRGLGPEPDSLDPQRAASVEAQTVLHDICEGLTTLNRHAGVAPGAAREFTVSPDGKTYEFHLRDDNRWSNGDRVVAEDFVFALRRLADPKTASKYQQFVSGIANARDVFAGKKPVEDLGVRAKDDATVVIELTSPIAYFGQLLAHPSTCPVYHRSAAPKPDSAAGLMTVSNGAFVLQQWIPGSYILLKRNRYYWNDRATQLEGVRYLFIPDANDELLRYRGNGLHVTSGVSRGQFEWVKSNLSSELHLSPQLGTYFYGFNLERAPFKGHPKLRRALALAIDREKLTQSVLRAGELPAYQWIPPGVSGYSEESGVKRDEATLDARLAEARKLYLEEGYSASKPLHIELRYNTGETHTKVAVAIGSMWHENLGVDVKLGAEEFAALLQDIDNGNVSLFRSSWIADYNDAYSFLQFFETGSGVNLTRYQNDTYDGLLAHAQEERSGAMRSALLHQAEALMLEDQPVIPIYFYVNKHLVKPAVQGWYDNVLNVVYSKDLSLSKH